MLVGRAAPAVRTDRGLVTGTLIAWAIGRAATVVGALAVGIAHRKLSLVPRVFTVWDGQWYLRLAQHGYPHAVPVAAPPPAGYSTLAFFPGYPVLVRLLGGTSAAAVVVAWVAGAVAAVMVGRLAARVVGERAALPAAVAFCLFPGSFILSFAYAEGVAIALSAACLLALLDRRWMAAGVFAALATATRPNALVLVACCAVAAWQSHEGRRAWVAPVLAPAGAGLVVLMQWFATGSPTAWSQAEAAGWHQHFDFGASAARTFVAFLLDPFGHPVIFMVGVGMIVTAALLIEFRHLRPPPVVAVYTAGVLAFSYASSSFNGRPRFLLTAFPLLFPLARLPRWAFVGTMALSAAAMAILTWYAAAQGSFPP